MRRRQINLVGLILPPANNEGIYTFGGVLACHNTKITYAKVCVFVMGIQIGNHDVWWDWFDGLHNQSGHIAIGGEIFNHHYFLPRPASPF